MHIITTTCKLLLYYLTNAFLYPLPSVVQTPSHKAILVVGGTRYKKIIDDINSHILASYSLPFNIPSSAEPNGYRYQTVFHTCILLQTTLTQTELATNCNLPGVKSQKDQSYLQVTIRPVMLVCVDYSFVIVWRRSVIYAALTSHNPHTLI